MNRLDTPDDTGLPVRLVVVGTGPGDPGLLTLRAVDAIARADRIFAPDTVAAGVLRHARGDARVDLWDGGEADGSRSTAVVAACLAAREGRGLPEGHPGDGAVIVRLVPGCPATYPSGLTEFAACREAGIDIDVVPGVSPVTAVPAYAGLSLATGEAPLRVRWGRESGQDADPDAPVVVLGSSSQLRSELNDLATTGAPSDVPVAVVADGSTPDQRTVLTTLGEADTHLETIAARSSDRPLVAVLGQAAHPAGRHDWFESKPLFGWRVLVPRTMEQSGGMVERLAQYGAVGDVVPTISVEPPRVPAQLQRAINGLVTGRFEWVGFTSVNAVRAIREKFAELGLDARSLAGVRIAAVGGVTATALRDWGIDADLVPEREQSARGLLEVWPAYDPAVDPVGSVLLPRADIATDTLVTGLADLGWTVEDVTAYRTVRAAPPPAPVRAAIKEGAFDAVVFTSSSTVRNLVGIAGKPHPSTVVACIGPATATTAEEHGLRVDVVAPHASGDALVDALARYGRSLAQDTGDGLRTPRPREKAAARRRTVQS